MMAVVGVSRGGDAKKDSTVVAERRCEAVGFGGRGGCCWWWMRRAETEGEGEGEGV